MTTVSQINKLYSQLPPSVLASLVMNAAVAGDFEEADKIMAAVPRKSYICPDVQYQWRRDVMETGLLALGVEYWHCVSMMLVANASVLTMAHREGVELSQLHHADQTYQKWANYHQALDEVVRRMCQEAGLDEQRIRTWLRIPPKIPTRELDEAGQAAVDERLAVWRKALAV